MTKVADLAEELIATAESFMPEVVEPYRSGWMDEDALEIIWAFRDGLNTILAEGEVR